MTPTGTAQRPRILVVEDEMMIALTIEETLGEMGCEVVGPVSKLSLALAAARDEAIDAAVLDVNIRGEPVFPVADILDARGIPLAFSSGYDDWALPEGFRGRQRLTKPFTGQELEAMVRSLCGL